MHELGHAVQKSERLEKESISMQLAAEDFFYHSNLSNPALLLPYLFLEECRQIKECREAVERSLTQTDLGDVAIENFINYQRQYYTLSKEMYADCFCVLMCERERKLNLSLASAIQLLIECREQGVNEKFSEIGYLNQDITHRTSFALKKLSQLIKKKCKSVQDYSFSEIKRLCTEAMTHGLIQMIQDTGEQSNEYQNFVNCVCVDVFDQNYTGSNIAHLQKALTITKSYSLFS